MSTHLHCNHWRNMLMCLVSSHWRIISNCTHHVTKRAQWTLCPGPCIRRIHLDQDHYFTMPSFESNCCRICPDSMAFCLKLHTYLIWFYPVNNLRSPWHHSDLTQTSLRGHSMSSQWPQIDTSHWPHRDDLPQISHHDITMSLTQFSHCDVTISSCNSHTVTSQPHTISNSLL